MRSVFFIFLLQLLSVNYSFAAQELDTSLSPKADEEVSNVFRDMGVIQKKAMTKRERFLLSSYATLDFSDGPYTNYSLHINPGYAISDFLEVYANFVPYYFISERSIVTKISQLQLSNGLQASITAARPKYQYGVEVLWAPLYGKDSLGISRVVRSDTFLKFAASQIVYDTTTGMGFRLGLGKTFFLTKFSGFRFCLDYGYIESVVDQVKSFKGMLLTEFGMTFYL